MLCNIIGCIICCVPITLLCATNKIFSKEELTGAIDPAEMQQLKNTENPTKY
jgi:hypothetical protein